VEIIEGEGAVLVVNVGHPIVTNEILCVRGSDVALPKLLWDFLLPMLAVHCGMGMAFNCICESVCLCVCLSML